MTSETKSDGAFGCPIPIEQYPNVLLAHGGGGKLSHQLIENMFLTAFGNSALGTYYWTFDLTQPALGPVAETSCIP